MDQIDKTQRAGDANQLVTYFIEVIHSQGYCPDESLRKDLALRILRYLVSWWDESNAELCEGITTLSANLNIPDALFFLEEKRIKTKNPIIKKEVIDAINEILKS